MQFFTPIINYYEKEEKDLRKKLLLNKESCLMFKENGFYIKKTMESPQEIWEDINEVGERIYILISKFDDEDFPFWMIMICYLYEQVPSFVFFQTVSSSEDFLNEYRRGAKLDSSMQLGPKNIQEVEGVEAKEEVEKDKDNQVQIELSQEMMTSLEQKKSVLLADLLTKRKPSDIPFETFHVYEGYVPSTIENPDEVYKDEDEDSDEYFVYLKGHQHAGVSFYHVVLGIKLDVNQANNDDVIYPILSFPTLDGDLVKSYCQGEKVSGQLRN